MKKFKCKTTFIDDTGLVHQYDKEINEDVFNSLTSQQQRKYTLIGELEAV